MTRLSRLAQRLSALGSAVLLAGCSVFGAPAAEEPPYELVREDGAFEIRAYPAIAVVRTTVREGDRDSAVGEGFGRLFDYISGANRPAGEGAGSGDGEDIAMTAPVMVEDGADGRSISMTAPVMVEPGEGGGNGAGRGESAEGEGIAMTAPVMVDEGAGEGTGGGAGRTGETPGWTVTFVLPEGMSAETAPRPTDPDVSLATIPPRRVAVYRFSGFFSAARVAEGEAALRDWLDEEGLEHRGDWASAGYNPPWTLPWLRRNEVMVTLAE